MYDQTYRNPADPPLSELGIKQAIDTGNYLKNNFDVNKYSQIVIESSPYLSAMMTAAQIASILGVENVCINYKASEIIIGKRNGLANTEFLQFGCDFSKM